jgi:hypothetical protein
VSSTREFEYESLLQDAFALSDSRFQFSSCFSSQSILEYHAYVGNTKLREEDTVESNIPQLLLYTACVACYVLLRCVIMTMIDRSDHENLAGKYWNIGRSSRFQFPRYQ